MKGSKEMGWQLTVKVGFVFCVKSREGQQVRMLMRAPHPHPSQSKSGGHEDNSWKQGLKGVGKRGAQCPVWGSSCGRRGQRAAPVLGTLDGG